MKKKLFWKIGTALKDWAERTNHSVIKGIGYRLRGHAA